MGEQSLVLKKQDPWLEYELFDAINTYMPSNIRWQTLDYTVSSDGP